jgi:Flp pilus assembly protein TadD
VDARVWLSGWLLAGVALAADGPWQRVETPHFVVVSEGPVGSARDMARNLEEFHALLARLTPSLEGHVGRLPVLVLRSRAALVDRLPPRKAGGYASLGAWFVSDPLRPMVAVDGQGWEASTDLVFAGYYRTVVASGRQPRWLSEGMGEFLATTWIDGHLAHVGTPAPDTLATLAGGAWLPYDEVLAADWRSPIFRDPDAHRRFAAQTWLFVHWCRMDEDRTARLVDLVRRIDGGATPGEALAASFGLTTEALTEQLRSYTRTNRWLELRYDLAEPIDVDRAEATAASPAEVGWLLGRLYVSGGRLDDAEAALRAARDADPASWMPLDGLGLVADHRGDAAAALAAWRDAVARAPTVPAPYLSYAAAALPTLPNDQVPAVQAALTQALALDPSRVDGWGLLAQVSLRGGDGGAAKVAAGRGLQLDPHDPRLRIVLGTVLLGAGDLEKARLNAALAVAWCDDEALCADARELAAAVTR